MGFNNGPKLVTQGLDLLVDAADPGSYPGSGTVWTDLRSGITGSLTGSVTYTSEYYGGLTFSDSSSAVIFPGSTADYGTGSFTVEMAFKPDYIEGRHYLMAKNSGSFPNWSIYLSGSNGSGKLWSEWNVNASVSCSVSSSTTFETGSVYQVDVRILPTFSASFIYVDGLSENLGLGNNGGSLTTTSSLFIGNYSQNNTQNFSGSIQTVKTYLVQSLTQPPTNYNATATRFSKTPSAAIPAFELLVVAGGGGSGHSYGGGGGAGGLQYSSNYIPTIGISQVIVGDGGGGGGSRGANGQNSAFGSLISLGGGGGGGSSLPDGADGGSGGGAKLSGTSGGNGTSGQGTDGAAGTYWGGGGGGAGTPGQLGLSDSSRAGAGGSGSYIASFAAIGGSPAGWFAGGGGGGRNVSNGGPGGIGGGGSGNISNTSGFTGSANTGGGGGGGSFNRAGVKGGSGIVAIRYSGGPIALGGEITQSEGYTYHVYRTVGTSSFTIF